MARFAEAAYIRGSSGGIVEVDDNRLRINAISEFMEAVRKGWAFSWASLDKDPDAGDTMFALENNSTDYLLCIQQIIISMTVAGGSVCPVFTASGVTMAGTTSVDGVNLNRNSNNSAVPLATAYTDETGNGEAAGSWAKRLYMPQCLTSVPYVINVGGAVRLPNDHMIGVDVIEAATAANVTFIGWFQSP